MSNPWLSGIEMLDATFPEPEMIISPWLPTSGLVMLIGERGVGKTYITLALALSVAAGLPVLEYQTPKPRRVLYVDGEMNIADVRKRMLKLQQGMGLKREAFERLRFMSYALSPRGIPCIADPEDPSGRKLITRAADGYDLVVLDNLSALIRTGSADKADIWNGILGWLLKFRTEGKTVLIIDHKSNKPGATGARGTSRKEDAMDTCIELSVIQKHVIQWEFTKSRAFDPEDPFTYKMLDLDDNKAIRPERYDSPSELMKTARELIGQDPKISVRKLGDAIGRGKSQAAEIKAKIIRTKKVA